MQSVSASYCSALWWVGPVQMLEWMSKREPAESHKALSHPQSAVSIRVLLLSYLRQVTVTVPTMPPGLAVASLWVAIQHFSGLSRKCLAEGRWWRKFTVLVRWRTGKDKAGDMDGPDCQLESRTGRPSIPNLLKNALIPFERDVIPGYLAAKLQGSGWGIEFSAPKSP